MKRAQAGLAAGLNNGASPRPEPKASRQGTFGLTLPALQSEIVAKTRPKKSGKCTTAFATYEHKFMRSPGLNRDSEEPELPLSAQHLLEGAVRESQNRIRHRLQVLGQIVVVVQRRRRAVASRHRLRAAHRHHVADGAACESLGEPRG